MGAPDSSSCNSLVAVWTWSGKSRDASLLLVGQLRNNLSGKPSGKQRPCRQLRAFSNKIAASSTPDKRFVLSRSLHKILPGLATPISTRYQPNGHDRARDSIEIMTFCALRPPNRGSLSSAPSCQPSLGINCTCVHPHPTTAISYLRHHPSPSGRSRQH